MNAGENPRAALAALLPPPVAVPGTAEEVRPFSLAMFAALDAIRSPLLYGAAEDATPLAVIPSLFVACRGWREAQRPDLFARAMDWADALPPSALPALRDAVGIKKKRRNGTNGWIVTMAEWACETFGWTLDYALDGIPAASIVLLQRQARVAAGVDDTMPLSVEEDLRNGR